MRTWIVLGTLTGSLLRGCSAAPGDDAPQLSDAERLHAAVRQVTGVIVYDIFSPPQASRVYAYASVAAYEALRPAHPEYRTLAGQLNGLGPVPTPEPNAEWSPALAGVHAYMTVGRALTFSRARMDSLRTAMDAQFKRTGMSDEVYARSVAYGEAVAKHVLDWAAEDRFKQTRGYPKFTVTAERGRWVPTPPAYMDAVEPNWRVLRPFAMDSGGAVRPEPPYPFDTAQGSAFMREAREVRDVQKTLTDDQRRIVAFWDDNPFVMNVQGHTMFALKKPSPGGHWMAITAVAARKAHADVMRSAEAYARTAVALADGFISCWDEKFRSNVIRPETYVNAYVDPTWVPLLQTPPFPEYTSGHSVISAAAATVLADQFGASFAFVDSAGVDFGLPPRAFRSFDQAAEEAAISRLYGGIHYRRAVEQGALQGRRIGALVIERLRTRAAPTVALRP
jgi:hypothetical protein